MSNIEKISALTSLIVKLASSETHENIRSQFDCFSRADLTDEIILDSTAFEDDDERFSELCGILGIAADSDQAAELQGAGYIIFYF